MGDKSVFELAKERVDIMDYAEQNLRTNQRNRSGAYHKYFCPFHQNDRTEALVVYSGTQTFKCFGCGETGDVITLHARMNGLEPRKAAAELAGVEEAPPTRAFTPARAPKPEQAEENLREFGLAPVLAAAEQYALAEPEISARGISTETAKDYLLGVKYGYGEGSQEKFLARKYGLPRLRRLVIPRVFFGDVYGIETRLLSDAEEAWNSLDISVIDTMRCDQADYLNNEAEREAHDKGRPFRPLRPEDISDESLKIALFGPRYHSWTGSHNYLYNQQAVVRKREDDGEFWFPPLNDVVVNEGALCSLSLRDVFSDDGGYYAMAIKSKRGTDLRWMFRNVNNVWIVADQDAPSYNPATERWETTGLSNARKVMGMINGWSDKYQTVPKGGKAQLIVPLPGYKDANDVVRYGGPDTVRDWLAPYIQPVSREALRKVQALSVF